MEPLWLPGSTERLEMKKLILLAIMAAVTAIMVIPAIASAAEWEIDSENEKLPLTFTSKGGAATLKGGFGSINCTANTGTGSYTTKKAGTITQTFTGCKDSFGGECKSGTTAGQIVTFSLPFENIMIESTAQVAGGTAGILITPNASTGDFATFTCSVGTVTVTGNGLIGHISNPKCGGAFQTTGTLGFEEEAGGTGKQKYRQIETAGTEFDLKNDIPSIFVSNQTAVQIASGTVTYLQGTKMTCP
jgi:hypothetical protein